MIFIGRAVFFLSLQTKSIYPLPTPRSTLVSVFTDTCLHFARIVFGHHGIFKNEKKKVCR